MLLEERKDGISCRLNEIRRLCAAETGGSLVEYSATTGNKGVLVY